MIESCHRFGPEQRLAGILCEPETPPRFACVLVSAGLLSKAGPFRLYAELARRLAGLGIATLRFDLGGIGESLQEYQGRPLEARTASEIRAAVDFVLARYVELHTLALGGLCSGAEDAFRAAAGDPRVGSVFMIDPFAYRTAGWAPRHMLRRIVRRALRALRLYEPLPVRPGPRAVRYQYLTRAESLPLLATLLARRARVHFLYTAGVSEKLNHPAQLAQAFPTLDFAGSVTLDHFPALDHTQLLAQDREVLLAAIARRLAADAGDLQGG